MEWLDTYVIRARLFPAVLAIAPTIAFALASFAADWEKLGLPQVLITTAVAVLFFGFSDISRRLGRRIEKRMFASSGGRPFPTVLRHRDKVLDTKSKARYHAYLASKLNEKAPTVSSETKSVDKADAFYVLAGNWLRERTRDHSKFKVLFEENVVYGFRRNLLGLKWIGLAINATVFAASVWMLWSADWAPLPEYGAVLVVGFLHAIFFLMGVSEKSVLDASNQYGRQLVLSCETLIADDSVAKEQG
jgi:ABC-type multidrug transport system fused ATPase/permease subunit